MILVIQILKSYNISLKKKLQRIKVNVFMGRAGFEPA